MKSRWPMYTNDSLTGAPCQAHADDECLCDVVIPAEHPWSNAPSHGGMWAHKTAETALAARGVYDPTPLQIMLQIVALHDVIGNDIDNMRHAMEHIAKYHEYSDKGNNAAIGALTRAVQAMGPQATATALDMDVDAVLAQAFGATVDSIREARRIIAANPTADPDALRLLLGSRNPRNDGRRTELLRHLGIQFASHGDLTLADHHRLYDLVTHGASDEECARILNTSIVNVGRLRRGERGPLKKEFRAYKAHQKALKQKAKVSA